ncbi:MAG TPA: phospholipase D-like domain-containing protein [Acetobacteraceae bacterium]|nr:phospholipase D-like domain-containing protein [Acetobacteraceae bacterium]
MDTARAGTGEPNRILRPGETCWKLAHAGRMAVIIDAAAYFTHLKAAILNARHSILLIGWDFDTRVALDRDHPDPGLPNRLGPLLTHAVTHNRQLRVYALRWDLAFLKMPIRGTTPAFVLATLLHHRLYFRLDSHHPAEATHHQKIVVIDDCVAFCGGIDITSDRWDTPAHRDQEPHRVTPNGKPHEPWHDVTTAVDGEAARALGELARDRWQASTGWRPEAPTPGRDCWPEGLHPAFRDIDVAIARTEPAYDGMPEIREIEALYLAAIAAARRTIYLESQYFAARRISEALGRRLVEPDGPEVVIVNPKRAEGWLEEEAMGAARAVLLEELRRSDRHSRLRFYTPVTQGGVDIYVHAKVLVVDDKLLRVGSSNINNRSLGLDTECDLAVEVCPGDEDAPELRRAILSVRDSLVSEHLGVSCDALRAVLQEEDGSLVRTLNRLINPAGKTLVPFTPPALSDTERALARSHLLDPTRPESMSRTFVRGVRLFAPASVLALAAAGLFALGGAALAWRHRPA